MTKNQKEDQDNGFNAQSVAFIRAAEELGCEQDRVGFRKLVEKVLDARRISKSVREGSGTGGKPGNQSS